MCVDHLQTDVVSKYMRAVARCYTRAGRGMHAAQSMPLADVTAHYARATHTVMSQRNVRCVRDAADKSGATIIIMHHIHHAHSMMMNR